MISRKEDTGIDLADFNKAKEVNKFEDIEPQGWTILVRLYTKPKKSVNVLYMPDSVHDEQQFRSCVGLVIKKAKATYLDNRYSQTGKWCEVGDWVLFPRHAGYKITYDGMPTFVLKEDAIDAVLKNPEIIER